MELTAATVYVRQNEMLRRQSEIHVGEVVYWMVLYKRDDRFYNFAANRIAVISEGSDPTQWRYVTTEFNLGDDASRRKSIQSFEKKDKWLNVQFQDFFRHLQENSGQTELINHQTIRKDVPEVKAETVLDADYTQ